MSEEVIKQETISPENWKPSKNPWLISAPLMLAVAMYALDETISNVALPYMAGSFSCTFRYCSERSIFDMR